MKHVFLDFETATADRFSPCALGLIQTENDKIILKKQWLIQPPYNEYDEFNIDIHGITPEMTENSPTFDKQWPDILPYIQDSIVFAHNASFDMSVLRYTLDYYGIAFPTLDYACTMQMARAYNPDRKNHKLDSLCEEFGIEFQHHNAVEDSIAAFELYKKFISLSGSTSFDDFIKKYHITLGKIHDNTYKPCSIKRPYINNKSYVKKSYVKTLQQNKDAENNHPFFDKVVLFTGELQNLSRKEAATVIAGIGGIPVENYSKKVRFLVVGEIDQKKLNGKTKSNKMIKVEQALANGADIDILSGADFFDMLPPNWQSALLQKQ